MASLWNAKFSNIMFVWGAWLSRITLFSVQPPGAKLVGLVVPCPKPYGSLLDSCNRSANLAIRIDRMAFGPHDRRLSNTSSMEVIFPFFSKEDFKGVPSSRVLQPRKQFEAAVDRAVGDQVRSDGACGVDLWCALANVEWHGPDSEIVSYTFREAGRLVAWVREEGDYIEWYGSGEPGVVANWISDALANEGWWWTSYDTGPVVGRGPREAGMSIL